jgi:hypothetical protein
MLIEGVEAYTALTAGWCLRHLRAFESLQMRKMSKARAVLRVLLRDSSYPMMR